MTQGFGGFCPLLGGNWGCGQGVGYKASAGAGFRFLLFPPS